MVSLTRRDRWRQVALAAVSVVGLAGLGVWQYGRMTHITETDARVMADMVTISSRIDGWIVRRSVTDGDRVAAGDEVVVIDQREASLQLAELKAKAQAIHLQRDGTATRLRMAQGSAPAAVTAAQARRAAAEANVAVAASEVERTERDFRRTDALLSNRFSARQTWDLNRSQMEQAADRLRAAKAQRAEAEAMVADATAKLGDIDVLSQELTRLGFEAEQVEAESREKEIALSDRVLRSPIAGVVDRKFVEPGEYVIPGQRLLLLHDPKAVWVEANIKETKLQTVKVGQLVSLGVDAYPGLSFTGRVERIGNAATSQFALLPSPNPSGNFTKISQRVPVRIRVDLREEAPLRPGMMVEVDIDTAQD